MRIQFALRTRGRLPKLVKLWLCLQVSALLFLVASPVHAQVKRKSVTDLSATELMSLRRGVANMMARNNAPRGSADYRRSWIYWANCICISEMIAPVQFSDGDGWRSDVRRNEC